MKLFLSYRRDDSIDATDRIFERLVARFGEGCVFKDLDSIPFGVDFREHINQAVSQCDVLLAVIGDLWLDICVEHGVLKGNRRLDDPRDFVRIEIESAVRRGIPVIPILVGRAAMPREEDLPESLQPMAYRNAAEVRSGRDFHTHVDRLIRGIELLSQLGASAAPEAAVNEPTAQPERNEHADGASPGPASEPAHWHNSLWTFMVRAPAEVCLPLQGHQELYVAATCVSNQDYKVWVDAGGPHPRDNPKGRKKHTWTGRTFPAFMALHPVVLVTQQDALGFCQWLSQRERNEGRIGPEDYYTLPSADQWKQLVRNVFDEGNVVIDREWLGAMLQPTESVIWGTASPLGLYCLFGNAFEWCLDREQKTIRISSKSGEGEKRRVDCALAIGGGWASSKDWLRQEVAKGTMGSVWYPADRPMQDGGFRLWLVKQSPRSE